MSTSPAIPWYRRPKGILFLYVVRCAVVGYMLGPIAASFCLGLHSPFLTLPAAFAVGLLCGALCISGKNLPPSLAGRYLTPLLFCWLLLPAFFPYLVAVGLGGLGLSPLRFTAEAYIIGLVIGFVVREQRRQDKLRLGPAAWTVFCVLLLIPLCRIGFETYNDVTYAKKRGHGFERVGGFSDTDLTFYDPRVSKAVTPRLAEPSSFTVAGADNLPVLDGAEAAFPVYAAFAAACYPDLPPLTEREQAAYDYRPSDTGALTFTNTIYAFNRLLEGTVDIFFGAQPSARQREAAQHAGKELRLTPIGKEAFVFFVNEANPINALSTQQIRDIYSGKIRNWKEAGGADAPIIAFQRPENSGSQTIMIRFMGDTELEPALQDRYVGGMGGIVERTSEYRNAPSAVGYSFHFFLTGMGKRPHIKVLSVDGVYPDRQSIRSGVYPHVVNLYAVTVKDNSNPHIAPFLKWMQGPQGQELVERVGYVRIK